MIRLYDNPVSGNCYKVRLLLAQLEIPIEKVHVDVFQRQDRIEKYGKKNPVGKIPILELEDGRCIGESNAILYFLGEGTRYLSKDPFERIRTLQWMFFEQNNLEANIAIARYWANLLKKEEEYREPLKVRRAGGAAALAVLERYLADHPFLVENQYSIADICLYAYTHVAGDAGLDLGPYGNIGKWLARIPEQPRYIPMMENPEV